VNLGPVGSILFGSVVECGSSINPVLESNPF
jgi:hypothetical protein